MVVLIIDKNRVFPFESKREPPIRIYTHGPMTLESAAQSMELPARHIHLFGRRRHVQQSELLCELRSMTRLKFRLLNRFERTSQCPCGGRCGSSRSLYSVTTHGTGSP